MCGVITTAIKNYTTYSVGVMKSVKYPNEARDYLVFLGGSAKPFLNKSVLNHFNRQVTWAKP